MKLKTPAGLWIDNEQDVAQVISGFYDNLFSASEIKELNLVLSYVHPSVSEEQNDWLVSCMSREELKQAIFHLGATKAPGPDGFNGNFYQASWEEVSETLFALVNNILFKDESFGKFNETNLVLIPKIEGPESVSQFRPISLCNFAFKVISKILATRFKRVLD